jgi:hypothetical protein
MTPYQKLCHALNQANTDYSAYRQESFSFGLKFAAHFKAFLCAPEGSLRYVPLEKDDDNNTGYTVMGAMHMEEDGFWHLGMILLLEANGRPGHEIKLHIRFKREGDAFRVGPFIDHDEFVVQPEFEDSFRPVFHCIVKAIDNYFLIGRNGQLEKSGPMRSIGFHASAA